MNRTPLLLAVVAGLSMLAACGHSKHSKSGVSGPQMNDKREAALLELAAKQLNCPEQGLVPAYVESDEKNLFLYRVAGCNLTYNALLHCVARVCNWIEMPDARAASELGCPAEQLQMKYLGNVSYSYSGCGRSATYTHVKLHWEGGPTQ